MSVRCLSTTFNSRDVYIRNNTSYEVTALNSAENSQTYVV